MGTSDWWSLYHAHTLPDRETGKEYLTCSASTIDGEHCLPPKVIIYSLGNFRNFLQLKGFRCYWKVKKKIPFLPHSFIFFQSLFFPFPLLVKLKKVVHTGLYFLISYSTQSSIVLQKPSYSQIQQTLLSSHSLTLQCYWIFSQLPWCYGLLEFHFFPIASAQLPLLTFPLLNLCIFVFRALSLPL